MASIKCEAWQPQGIDSLEPRALDALQEVNNSILVTAGPGAGKTEFLAQKAAYLLQTGICQKPNRILAISFKNDAARNLAERVMLRCTPEQARRFDSITFDAFTKNMVDRFRKSIPDLWMPPMDYRIIMPKRRDLEEFLAGHGHHDIHRNQLLVALSLTNLPLPDNSNGSTLAAVEYWYESYHSKREVELSFLMINRLVHWMLRINPSIKSALQKTYQFIFLDEFQDTTHAQFDLLNTAFHGGPAKLTAVGDDKQRIMLWAGAIPDAFDQFESTYGARRVSLLSNWRSHEELVAIQHLVARRIDQFVEHPEARGIKRINGDIASIWDFPDTHTESNILARWISAEVEAHTVEPHNVAILVRFDADKVEKNLIPEFSAQGLKLRNLARELKGISIQDILNEELTGLLFPLLRLGATARSPVNWDILQRNLIYLNGNTSDDHAAQHKDQEKLQKQVRSLRLQMCDQPPCPESAITIATTALNFWTTELIQQSFLAYRRQQDFNRVWNGFLELLVESIGSHNDWSAVLDEFEGLGQVPLMTIHKSKGLEFHTMIFYGLDNKTWWSLNPNNQEDLNVFFVALTRAEQRAFFTLCRERGESIEWLEQLIRPAGVHRIDGLTLVKDDLNPI